MLVFSTLPPPPRSTLFPYTTLFRSRVRASPRGGHRGHLREGLPDRAPTGRARHAHPQGDGGEQDRRGSRGVGPEDRKSTRLNSSHPSISYAVFCLKKKK